MKRFSFLFYTAIKHICLATQNARYQNILQRIIIGCYKQRKEEVKASNFRTRPEASRSVLESLSVALDFVLNWMFKENLTEIQSKQTRKNPRNQTNEKFLKEIRKDNAYC